MNRKEFFKTTGRLLILGGITASAGYLLVNKKVSASCSVSPTCQNCGKFSKCELPQAKEDKQKPKGAKANSTGHRPVIMSEANNGASMSFN